MSTTPYIQQVDTLDGISWYTEMYHPNSNTTINPSDDYVVFIPSGEGDCYNHRKVAHLVSTTGPNPPHTLSLDMPGFSRTKATLDPETLTPQVIASQIIGLLDMLGIKRASMYGSSSGGLVALALSALYPSRVKCAIIHEIPLESVPHLNKVREQTDEQLSLTCHHLFRTMFIEQENDGVKKWDDLGEEYHARLKKNYVTWMRNYVGLCGEPLIELVSDPENLRRRSLFWTVGSLNPGASEGQGFWRVGFVYAKKAGIEINTTRLRCLHFPNVTVPEELAGWIGECLETVRG